MTYYLLFSVIYVTQKKRAQIIATNKKRPVILTITGFSWLPR